MAESAISHLLSTVSTFIRGEFNLLRGVRDEIDLIRGEFEQMNAFLQVAGANEDSDPQFEAWVKQVRDTAYDAGDVLEQFMARLEHHHQIGGFYHCLSEAYNFRKTINIRHQIAIEVQRIKTKVNAISQSRQRYANHFDVQSSSANTVSTSTGYNSRHDALLLSANEIVGITNPKSKLIEWLVDEFRHELKVISVSGMGGLGKTTLVKKVYDDAEIVKFFEAHAWITVSKPFRIKELLKGLIKELYSELKRQVPDTVEDMDQYGLKRLVNEFLQEKRYVIVLDDVWNTDVWSAIRYAFPYNNCSCRVILTTREKYVASIGKVYILSPLPEKESLALFCLKAFKGHSCPPYLKETTEAILKKCSGLPLAIVSIGGLLATKDGSLDEWNKIYRGFGAELGKEGKLADLERVLSLSYFDLPWYLKLCFLYLSIFPEGYLIDHWRLIRLWIAEGFVQSTPGLTPEEVADNYLNELLNRSLILPASPTKNDRGKRYYVHDIWRELIFSRSIKQDMVTIFGAEQSSFSHRVRRLSIHSDMGNWQEIKKNATHVHSLLMFGSIDREPTMSIMNSIRTGARLLKVLDMRHSALAKFPRQIRKLVNLKYLSLRGSNIEEVPKSIGDLKMLETLDLKNTKVRKLPNEILKLHRLRHLLVYRYLDGPNYLCFHNHFGFKVPKGIEKLSCLQKLCSIEINRSDNDGIVRDLAALTQLRRINILQLRSKDADALCSTLDKLTELRSLSITMINEDETLNLELFCYPPKFLQKLTITGQIETFPWWMSSLHNLATLTLNYRKSNADPLPWLEYLPNLTSLRLNHAYEGVALSFEANTFRQLTFLSLYSSVRLRDVRVMEGAMPRLKKLVIGECPSMKELPSGIETLRYLSVLHLVGMPEILISSLDRDMRKENSRKIAHIATVLIAPQSGAEAQFSYIL